MHHAPFFTALDPDARIKGSRDPLGFERIWTAFGREVVGNLTTVTRSVRQFSTLLFGFHLANQATESPADRDDEFLPVFLRFEQLAAYARYRGDQAAARDIRGIRAVRRNVERHRRGLWLSRKSEWQLLSDQKTYGLYGLFRMAACNSGWLHPDRQTQLSPRAREFVERRLLPVPRRVQDEIVRSIAKDTKIDLDKSSIVGVLAELLQPQLSSEEGDFYGPDLVRGVHQAKPWHGQSQLWDCIEAVNSPPRTLRWSDEFDMAHLHACIELARSRGHNELADRLDRIRRAEELLGAAAMLYDFLLTQDKQPIDTVAKEIAQAFGDGLSWLNVADLCPVFGESAERLVSLAQHLAGGRYAAACRTLIEHNDEVMRQRGGNAWIVLKQDTLEVRFLEEGGNLPTLKEIQHPWVHTYFLNALKRVGACVYHGQTGGDEDAAE